MEIIDYNGEEEWSREAILSKYSRYCRELGINELDLSPMEHGDSDRKWVYPVMDKVIGGIERGDAACTLIGIEFIEEDQSFSFGRILKSNTARALRRASLSDEQKTRIRRRVVDMLVRGYVPHEYKEYAKLLRGIGLEDCREIVEGIPSSTNPRVTRFVNYLLND